MTHGENKPERLDSFSKILIATGQINYMASSIDGVQKQIVCLPDENGYHKDGIEERRRLLEITVRRLTSIAQEMGEFINSRDMLCPIDIRVSKVPFEILGGMDEVEKEYQSN